MPKKQEAAVPFVPAKTKPPFDAEAFAQNIQAISDGMQALLSSRLRKRAIVLLLNDSCGVSMANIVKVLDALPELSKTYLR